MNDITLTIRLPKQLDDKLKDSAKKVGMPKSTLIRICIHDFLVDSFIPLDFTPIEGDKRRMTLDVNELTKSILDDACSKYGQSMNAVVTAVSLLALERAAKWLQSTAK